MKVHYRRLARIYHPDKYDPTTNEPPARMDRVRTQPAFDALPPAPRGTRAALRLCNGPPEIIPIPPPTLLVIAKCHQRHHLIRDVRRHPGRQILEILVLEIIM